MTSLEGHPYTKYLLVERLGESGIVTFASMNCTVRKKESRHVQYFRRGKKQRRTLRSIPIRKSTSQRDRRRRRPLGRWKEEAGGDRGMEVVEEKMVGFGKERLHRGGGGGKGESVVLSLHLLFPSLSSADKNSGFLLFLFRSSARERERDGQRSSDHDAPPPPPPPAKQHSCPSPVHLRS